jgi:hypothetical protein
MPAAIAITTRTATAPMALDAPDERPDRREVNGDSDALEEEPVKELALPEAEAKVPELNALEVAGNVS